MVPMWLPDSNILAPAEVERVQQLLEEPPIPEEEMIETILGAGVLQRGEFTFSDGTTADNKLDMDLLFEPRNRDRLHVVLAGLGRVASLYQAEALWSVPPHSDELALAIGQVLRLPVIEMWRTRGQKDSWIYVPKDFEDEAAEVNLAASRVVGIKDVSSSFASIEECLQSPEIRSRTKAVAVIWARGMDPEDSDVWDLGPHLHSLVYEPVPQRMSDDDPLVERAREAAAATLKTNGEAA